MMFNFNQGKKILAIVGCAFAGLLSFSSAYAANPEPVTAEVQFIAPVAIAATNALQYGLLDVNLANLEEVIIAPNGNVTDLSVRVAGGTQAAAALTVSGVALPITIVVDTIASGAGYSLDNFMCNYDGGVDTACGAPGFAGTAVVTGAPLLVGARLLGDGTAGPGPADGSFNVTVTYQ
jgi:hypothetical protein